MCWKLDLTSGQNTISLNRQSNSEEGAIVIPIFQMKNQAQGS